jgi:hypothetical protein
VAPKAIIKIRAPILTLDSAASLTALRAHAVHDVQEGAGPVFVARSLHVARSNFANGGTTSRSATLTINGAARTITFPATRSRTTYQQLAIPTSLNSGTVNTVRIDVTGQDAGDIDEIEVR